MVTQNTYWTSNLILVVGWTGSQSRRGDHIKWKAWKVQHGLQLKKGLMKKLTI
jgi:hypothetical protein